MNGKFSQPLEQTTTLERKLPRLSNELRVSLSRRMALTAFFITALASSLHLGWSLYQRSASQDNLRNALAQSLQEPLRSHDLPAVHAILQAFAVASRGAEICVQLPGGDWLKEPRCGSAAFVSYPMNLSKDKFAASVTLPIVDRMVLVGIPFGLAILLTLLLISQYLKEISRKVLSDLEQLSSSPGASCVHYQELAEASAKIVRGFQLHEENLKLAADAQIGSIAGLAGHDIRAPLETLQVLASEIVGHLPLRKQRVFESITRRINDVAEDLLEIRKATIAGSGAAIEWPPRTRQGCREAKIFLVPLIESMMEEKSVLYQCRAGLEIVLRVGPSAQGMAAILVPRDFERVLSNLIGNGVEAIDGSGKIEVLLSRDGDCAEFSIRDTGRGIVPEHLSELMQKGKTFNKENGSGLALFHAREMIESRGGTILIESEPTVGTTVHLRIPLISLNLLPEVLEQSDLILIDDNPIVHDGWSLVAEEQGLRLVSFFSAADFLSQCQAIKHGTAIYVDKNGIEDGIKVGATLLELGFQNLHLTTGERFSAAGSPPPGFKSVVGKSFPSLTMESSSGVVTALA